MNKMIFLAATAALMGTVVACHAVSADGKEWVTTPESDLEEEQASSGAPAEAAAGAAQIGSVQQALTGTHKLCTVKSVSANFRDTIDVPNAWTSSDCLTDYRVAIGGTSAQLACLTENGVVLGNGSGGLPSPNCGW